MKAREAAPRRARAVPGQRVAAAGRRAHAGVGRLRPRDDRRRGGAERLFARLQKGESELEKARADKARIERRLRALSSTGAIEVEEGKVILQGEVLFATGSDDLSTNGRATLQRMAPALAALVAVEPDQIILVGGHTDDVPISNERFASNWELSAARSTAVARCLVGAGLPADRVVASGFGAFHPRMPNQSPEERRRNRRIEVLVVPVRAVSSR